MTTAHSSPSPLVSVVIPTKNRQRYADIAVRKILTETIETEVILSDTSADSSLKDLLADVIDGQRVRYTRPEAGIDVVSNFELALGHAQGRFIMFIGDDDCIGPGLEQIARWADREQIDALFSYGRRFIANYFWPGIRSKYYGDRYAASLFVYEFTGEARPAAPLQALARAADDLGRGLDDMPRLYHGMISRELSDRIRAKYGRMFGGVTPDIFSATLISVEAQNPWRIDYPFCLPGGSPPSTAGTGAARSDRPDLWNSAHIRPFRDLIWDPRIPEYYTPANVWAFSLTKALETVDIGIKPNFARLYAKGLLGPRSGHGAVHRSARFTGEIEGQGGSLYMHVTRELARETAYQSSRLLARLRHPGPGGAAERLSSLPTIADAFDRLVELGDGKLKL